MLKMDGEPDKRQAMFKSALSLTRHAFPRRDMTSRIPENDPIWKKHMPQVLSLQSAFERSDPPIASDMEFAGLLSDAGSFLWEQQLNRIALPVLNLGEKIALELLQEDEPSPVLASLENILSLLDAHESAENRAAVVARMKRVVRHRERFLKTLAPGTATVEQQVDVGRAWNDLAYIYADMEQFEEADSGMAKSLTLYKSLGDESTLRFRFALQYADLTVVRLGQGRINEALELARKSHELCEAEIGHQHLETVRFESQWAYALIAAGDLHGALGKLADVLAVRSKLLERDNPDILTTKYWIGTVHYYLSQLEDAEYVTLTPIA
jgi:tetratricopeptide (TPR) repeat protein